MTTFYLDFEGGNDANDGTSFANRWKKINSGATTARIAAGDTIRVMASRDPISLGSCTWTDGSGTVVMPSAKTQTIWNGDEAWTAGSANITVATDTGVRKIGSTSAVIKPASGFTTGKAAYKTLPSTLDLSAYSRVSMWVRLYNNTSGWQVKLCSDSTGDTAVHTLTIGSQRNSAWVLFEFDNGDALGSTINSVAVYATSDPGTNWFYVQNIIACKAAGDANALTHSCVLRADDGDGEALWPIDTIDGTDIVLGGEYGRTGLGSSDVTRIPYRGSGGSITTYALEPIDFLALGQMDPQDSGTSDASRITYSFGWNRTDMSTKADWSACSMDALTLVSAKYRADLFSSIWRIYVTYSGLGVCHFYDRPLYTVNTYGVKLDRCYASGCWALIEQYQSIVTNGIVELNDCVATMCNRGLELDYSGSVAVVADNVTMRGMYANCVYAIGLSSGGLLIKNSYLECGNTEKAIYCDGRAHGKLDVRHTTLATQGSADFYAEQYIDASFFQCNFSQSAWCYTSAASRDTLVHSHNHNGSSGDHRIASRGWSGASESSVRHTASGLAWKLSPTDATYCDSLHPAKIPIAKVAYGASAEVTIKCWLRRTNTGLTAGLLVDCPQPDPDDDQEASAEMTAAADTWEEVTVTFTAGSEAGVAEIFAYAYGGTTYSAYFDDMTITQA